ncbi:MAG: Stress responsive A/B Barrel Domain protein [Methanomassiliicoccales archaeon PtaU1.Bin124]|nr:MAG: Stress responsive A/B Barrel Domain protein [Methanomassiliicoccales archaeon PtaU1.Bin124]
MIRHVVMWRLKNHAEGHSRAENAALMNDMLLALSSKVPEIRNLQVGFDVLRGEGSYDLVLMVDLDDLKALERYQRHPDHVKVAEFVSKVRESRAVVDFAL